MTYDALVLAGGAGRRLGGVSKAEVRVGGRALIDHVLDAVADARRTVVVGPSHLARPGVPAVLEDPPSGGPVAGIDAGLRLLDRQDTLDDAKVRDRGHALDDGADPSQAPVVVLACDVPLAAAAVPRLLAALADDPASDGAHLIDVDGRSQALVAVYRRPPLRAALARVEAQSGGVRDVAVRRLVGGLAMMPVADPDGQGRDADTWPDVAELDAAIRRRSDAPLRPSSGGSAPDAQVEGSGRQVSAPNVLGERDPDTEPRTR